MAALLRFCEFTSEYLQCFFIPPNSLLAPKIMIPMFFFCHMAALTIYILVVQV